MPAFDNNLFEELAKNKVIAREAQGANTWVAVGVMIMSGPFTVSSKTKQTKWESGWVDFLVPLAVTQLNPVVLEQQVTIYGELPRVSVKDFGKYKFQFFKPEEHY